MTRRSDGAMPQDITELDATALSEALHARRLRCREVMAACLARIDRLNPGYNAIVAMADEAALLRQAEQADRELDDGRSRGWLHGLPFAVKDTGDAKGFATTMGSALLAGAVAAEDCLPVGRLRKAGAIVIGKSNVPEFALGSQTVNSLFGATRNALDPALCAGGSSGGAAVALALRLVPVADGSDMMGSLRNPAAYNGVFGFRPTTGAIAQFPLPEPFVHRLATFGPMARSLRDLRRLFATMAGPDRRDPLSHAPAPDPGPPASRPLRVGWLGDWNGAMAMEAGVLETCEAALAAARERVDVVPVVPDIGAAPFWEAWCALRSWALSTRLGPFSDAPESAAQLKPEALWEIARGRSLTRADIDRALRQRAECHLALSRLFDRVDVLAAPCAQCFAFDVDRPWPETISGTPMDTYHRWMEVTVAASLTACPAVAIPAGTGPDGRAMGLQLIGPPGSDLALLRVAGVVSGTERPA